MSGVVTHRQRISAIAASALLVAITPGLAVAANEDDSPKAASVVDETPGQTSLAEAIGQIGADEMWAAGFTGDGIDVAIIDTGIAPVTELSTTDVFVGPDLSFEGNIDDVAGLDTFGHGTHIAGIIAGRTPGADPLAPRPDDFIGVAPDSRIVSVRVADNTGAADVSQVIAAIDWVVQNRNTGGLNIRVLNLSYNTDSTQHYIDDPLSRAVENAGGTASSSWSPAATRDAAPGAWPAPPTTRTSSPSRPPNSSRPPASGSSPAGRPRATGYVIPTLPHRACR